MKKRIIIISLIVYGPIIIVLWFGVFFHDWNLYRLEKSFSKLPHPPGTRYIATYKNLGLLVGNGNHCDYFVARVHSYQGSKSAINQFYSKKQVWNPISHKMNIVEVAFLDDGKLTGNIDRPVEDIVRKLKPRQKRIFIVYVLDPGYDTRLDIRCL